MINLLYKLWIKAKSIHANKKYRFEGSQNRAIEIGRSRLIVVAAMFVSVFLIIAIRMVDVTVIRGGSGPHLRNQKTSEYSLQRADIVDRNGILLATSLPSTSLYAHPKEIKDKAAAAAKLHQAFPESSEAEFMGHLDSGLTFVYLRRNLTPKQEFDANSLGIPGLFFEKTEKRIYPQENLTSHVIGLTDLDGKGIAGIEKHFERALRSRHEALRLSLDVRIQTILRNELLRTMSDFKAIGATGVVMDVHTGEVIAMVSLPDFNPNALSSASKDAMFNRATLGVYEMGSTFKLFNTAAAIDCGTAKISSIFDASHPINIGRFHITDYHAQNRWLTVPEILIYSSNIGSAKMAVELGGERQKAFLERVGMLRPVPIELPEAGSPKFPSPWREINTMTIAYGHGMAVTPLHMINGVSSLVNGGLYHPATILYRDDSDDIPTERVIKKETSDTLLQMMRMVVTEGTAQKADVTGYEVAGKTGTAEKNEKGNYHHKSLISSFIATFPMSEPRYVVLAMLDEPHGTKESFGFATAGWTATPAVGRIISQIGPLMGMEPMTIKGNGEDSRIAHETPRNDGERDKEFTFAKAQ